MMRFLHLVTLGFIFALLAGCQTTSQGIGTKSSVEAPKSFNAEARPSGKEVLLITFERAMRLAVEASTGKFTRVTEVNSKSGLLIQNVNFWQGDVEALVEPVLVENTATGDRGITYKIDARGVGANMSLAPGYVVTDFFEELAKVVEANSIPQAEFLKYKELQEKGATDSVAASIPTNYDGFTRYIDGRSKRDPFEGVWSDNDEQYTLGLIRDDQDLRYPYKAFILDSQQTNWAPGEIKMKFSKLDSSGLAVARYWLRNKLELGVTFNSSSGGLVSVVPDELGIVFIKMYPRESSSVGGGSGSGWFLGNNFVVTNAHVIDGADAIEVSFDGNTSGARALVVDQKLDLAILVLSKQLPGLKEAPIANEFSAGQRVFALGHPLGQRLGKDVKITDGLISATQGLDSDPTQLTISAPIQPGSSGGPLFDDKGNVVGIIVARLKNQASPDGDVENVNYAVNVKYLLPLIENLEIPVIRKSNEVAENICQLRCSSVVYIETK